MKKVVISWFHFRALIICSITLFLSACRLQQPASTEQVVVFWKEGKATALILPKSLLAAIPEDSIPANVIIRMAGQHSKQPIAGSYRIRGEEVWFEPLIPFTRGLRYEVIVLDSLLQEIHIQEATDAPTLIAIYPSQDTLPENLLKIYLVFSKPMAATPSLQHVFLKDEQGDTLKDVFLDLPNELWNEDRTIMTLWMNPGRVKRELQPNKLLGAPLERGQKYRVVVSAAWKDAEGKSLDAQTEKVFVAAARDAVVPSPDHWKLHLPEAGTMESLRIELDESLDYSLLKNTITVEDSTGNRISGSVHIADEETMFHFKPQRHWNQGLYRLVIETRLEDLAGNNLNRPFDRNLQDKNIAVNDKPFFVKEWRIISKNKN